MFLAIAGAVQAWELWTDTAPFAGPGVDLLLPHPVWAVIFSAVTVVCAIQSFAKLDRIAFSVSVGLITVWALILFYSWAYTGTNPHAFPMAIKWFAFAGVTAIVSNWPEHRPFTLEDFDGDDHD